MKHLLTLALLCTAATARAQSPYEGTFTNRELNIRARLHLEQRDIPVPGLELDSCYGYLQGSLNGAWVILRVKSLDGRKALVRAVSERGADAQDLEIQPAPGGGISLRQLGGTCIKGVRNRGYVKLPKAVDLARDGE